MASHSVPWALAGGTVGLLDLLVTVGLGLASHDVYGLASHGVHGIASHSGPAARQSRSTLGSLVTLYLGLASHRVPRFTSHRIARNPQIRMPWTFCSFLRQVANAASRRKIEML